MIRALCICIILFPSMIADISSTRADTTNPCDKVHTVTVTPEEYVGDKSLTKLMSHLISVGRKMAVEQVTTTRVFSTSSEIIQDDTINFESSSSERFVGTVISHNVVERKPGLIGDRETLKITLEVNVCVEPSDQIWYVEIKDISSELHGNLEWMRFRIKSPTDRIQLVHSKELGANRAAYRIQGLVFSESISLRPYSNHDEIQTYHKCIRQQRSQAQAQSQLLNSFGFGQLGGVLQGLSKGSDACGHPPKQVTGQRLEGEAMFEIKICDTHFGDCQSVRQPYQSYIIINSRQKEELELAARQFYDQGFGFVGSLALHNLQQTLGIINK